MRFDHLDRLAAANRAKVLTSCLAAFLVIALFDAVLERDYSIGMFYLFPLMFAAAVLRWHQIVLFAVLAAVTREHLGPTPWDGGAPLRLGLALFTYTAAGFVVLVIVRRHNADRQNQTRLHVAESEAQMIVEGSPAAILTVNSGGAIDRTNDAALRLLGLAPGSAVGRKIEDFFPTIAEILRSPEVLSMVRTMVECRGTRADGESFFAQMWLSSFPTEEGVKLVAVVADISEQMRDREELGLRQLLTSSSIIAGAVSHEIRNLAAAAELLYNNIGRRFELAGNEDFDALGRLIEALRKLAAPETPSDLAQGAQGVDINSLLGELRIILGSGTGDVEMEWHTDDELPRVRVEHSAILQVLLNLTRNSQRALAGRPGALIRIRSYALEDSIMISVADNGPGVARPELLFHPFQPGAQATGLGLYVSRAIVRTFGGELQYERRPDGSRFVIQLPLPAAAVAARKEERKVV